MTISRQKHRDCHRVEHDKYVRGFNIYSHDISYIVSVYTIQHLMALVCRHRPFQMPLSGIISKLYRIFNLTDYYLFDRFIMFVWFCHFTNEHMNLVWCIIFVRYVALHI